MRGLYLASILGFILGCADNNPVQVMPGYDGSLGPTDVSGGGDGITQGDGARRDVPFSGDIPPHPDYRLPPLADLAPADRTLPDMSYPDIPLGGEVGPQFCVDLDGDGYGEGPGCWGPDCNDADALRNVDCTQPCLNPLEGCPCEENTLCYEGPPGTEGVGICRGGIRLCQNGLLGPCLDQNLPQDESCNSIDDNCDGAVDDGVDNPCGDCTTGCTSVILGGDEGSLDETGTTEGLEPAPDGSLRLSTENISYGFVWTANTGESTVTKLDAQTGAEVARYPSVMATEGVNTRPLDEACNSSNSGNCPSRTAVDLRGDVFVANRAFGHQGTVTKIAGDMRRCLDRNDDGVITTSQDLSGDGIIDIEDPAEFPGLDDECLLFTVAVGESNGIPRALAICEGYYDGGGTVWVGTYNEQRMTSLDNADGHTISQVDVTVTPYGAVCDSHGTLWVTQRTGDHLVGINTHTLETHDHPIISDLPDGCVDTYGIGLDGANRVWLNGRTCEAAFRYDPAEDEWMTVDVVGHGKGRGIGVDAQGRVWMGHSHNKDSSIAWGHVTSFNANDGSDVVLYDVPGATGTVGVGADFFGNVWAINQSTNNATRINPATGEMEVFPVGRSPYTYSDFTGFTLMTFTAPRGTYTTLITGCDQGPTQWRSLAWEATLYPETSVAARYRVADRLADLASLPWSSPADASPADLAALPTERLLQVEFTLESRDEASSPLLHGVEAVFVCLP